MLLGREISILRGSRRILDTVSMKIAGGEIAAVIGPNGAGKSTLLQTLSGALAPDGGMVEIGGRALKAWPTRELAKRRAVLSQNATLGFPFTALQVVLIGRSPHMGRHAARADLRAAANAMSETGVLHLAERSYPTLSGGEKQRVQLARVLAQIATGEAEAPEQRYLLLDEPTNNLDLAHQHLVLNAARRLADSGVAVLAVLHDPNHAAAYADRIHVLHHGRIVAAGVPREVLTPQLMASVFGVSARVLSEPGRDRPYVLIWPGEAPSAAHLH
jgi:iron complex transport system ATP-binding protein